MTKKNFSEIVKRIANNDPELTEVDLSENNLGKGKVVALAKALQSNTNLRSLNLSNNPIGSSGIIFLAEVVANQQEGAGIEKLEIRNCRNKKLFSDNYKPWKPSVAVNLAEVISKNPNIRVLDFSSNQISIRDEQILVSALEKNHKIEQLYFFSDPENEFVLPNPKRLGNSEKSTKYITRNLFEANVVSEDKWTSPQELKSQMPGVKFAVAQQIVGEKEQNKGMEI